MRLRTLSVVCCLLSVALSTSAQPTTDNRQPITASFRPAQPTVGDLITIEFQKPVVLDASPHYEIVSQSENRVVLRTFEPKPFSLSGQTGDVRFRNLVVPMRSVLKPGDDLKPAPLKPPHPVEYPELPRNAIGIAALVAAGAWLAAYLLARRRRGISVVAPYVDPADRFRTQVAASRGWASLADATRLYLSTLSPHLGRELTTSQILGRVDAAHAALVATILRQGDFEKFSPWGAPAADFNSIRQSALTLIPEEREEEAA